MRRLRPAKNRVLMRSTLLHHDGKPDGGDHKDHGAPDCHFSENSCSGAGAKSCLRALAAEGAGKIGALALLQQNNADENHAYDDVNGNEEINHEITFLRAARALTELPYGIGRTFGAEGGT